MTKCLFFLSFCLLPFVVFSSTFTSENPIDLPTAPNFSGLMRDLTGKTLNTDSRYRIVSSFWGPLDGDVYLGFSPNSTTGCRDGVFRYNSDIGSSGTPVKFTKFDKSGPVIFEKDDINIEFSTSILLRCVNYTIWKVGDYDASLGARLLETGGTKDQPDSSWFKIVKASSGYNLFYCPSPFACPSCPVGQCEAVGEVLQDGRRRLALEKNRPLDVNFQKV